MTVRELILALQTQCDHDPRVSSLPVVFCRLVQGSDIHGLAHRVTEIDVLRTPGNHVPVRLLLSAGET